MTASYVVGQIFEDSYPLEAVEFCNATGGLAIVEIEPLDGHRRFQIQAVVPPPAPTPTTEQKLAALESGVERYINSVARQQGFESVYTAASFLNSKVLTLKATAEAVCDWRDQVWMTCRQLRDAFIAGELEELTLEDVIERLPTFGE